MNLLGNGSIDANKEPLSMYLLLVHLQYRNCSIAIDFNKKVVISAAQIWQQWYKDWLVLLVPYWVKS